MAEIKKKHEFQANYDRRSIQKLSETIESQQEELHCAQAEEQLRRDQQLLHSKTGNYVKLMIRSVQKLNEVIESQRGEIYRAHQGDEQLRRDQQLLHEQLSEQNRNLREAHMKSLHEKEELKRIQGSTFDTIATRKLVENQDTIHELTARIQELQNEVNCLNDSRDFKDVEPVRSGLSHVTSQPALLPLFRDPGGMLSRSLGMPSRNDKPPNIWDTHGISGNVFSESNGVFFITLSESGRFVDFRHNGTHITACNK